MDYEDFPEDWHDKEIELFLDMTDGIEALAEDGYLQELYHAALFDTSIDSREQQFMFETLVEYLADIYDLDFDDIFDWEDFRAWYESGGS